jgi:hypothetical protein
MIAQHQPSGGDGSVVAAVQQFLDEFEACFAMEHVTSASEFLGQIADRFPALLEAKEIAAEAIRRQQEGGVE